MIECCTVRWLVSKLQEASEGDSLRLAVFFWLTASERLDRLPQVFAASSDTIIYSFMNIH
jgi:hypothetical protein